MRKRKSAIAALLMLFLLALILNVEKTASQTLETKNQPERPRIGNSAEVKRAGRVVKLRDEFKSAIKNKKAGWELITDSNEPYGVSFLIWEMKDKKVEMQVRNYETAEDASRPFDIPVNCQVCNLNIPQKGFGDESHLTSTFYGYENEGIMTLTFRSGNYVVKLKGMKDDIFNFGKIVSDTISEKK